MQPVKSSILLFCLHPLNSQASAPSLRCDDLFLVFSVFSPLKKIVIFDKSPILKAFVEFESAQGALACTKELHDRYLDSFGKIKLYPSVLTTLRMGNKLFDSKDFTGVDRKAFLERVQAKLESAESSAGCRKKSQGSTFIGTDQKLESVREESEAGDAAPSPVRSVCLIGDWSQPRNPEKTELEVRIFPFYN